MDSLTRRYERSVELKSRRISSMAIIFPVQRNPAAGVSADRYRMASNPARIEPDGHGRRRFRSTLDILVRDSSACHERRGKPRRTRMSIVRLATSQPVSPRVRSYCCYLSSCCQNRPNVRPAGDDTRSPPLRGSHPRQPPHHKGYQADDAQKNITLCFGD